MTSFVFNLIYFIFPESECEHTNRLFIPVQFWSFLLRNLASGRHLLKKIDQSSWRITRRNYKHIPQIVCISSRFRVLHLLSWEFERSEALWRYTVILVCHLKHVEVGCISPCSFHRSPQRRREKRFCTTQYPCSTANGAGISSQSISKNLPFSRESFTCSNVMLALSLEIYFPWQ